MEDSMAAPLLASPADRWNQALRLMPGAYLLVIVIGAAHIMSVALGDPFFTIMGALAAVTWLARHKVYRLAG
jgi:hypothetical protein